LIGSSYNSETYASHFSRRTSNIVPDTFTGKYELESCEGRRKSGLTRKSKQQAIIDNESEEEILGDGSPKDISGRNEAIIISDAGPVSQKSSLRLDSSDIPPVSREGF
jgi:hypothetical protein